MSGRIRSLLAASGCWVARGSFSDVLKSDKPGGVKAMTEKKGRERVIAEITLSHT